jgi:hypothetical protein
MARGGRGEFEESGVMPGKASPGARPMGEKVHSSYSCLPEPSQLRRLAGSKSSHFDRPVLVRFGQTLELVEYSETSELLWSGRAEKADGEVEVETIDCWVERRRK